MGPLHIQCIHSNTPTAKTLAIVDMETGSKQREQQGGESLGEDASELGSHQDVEDTNVSASNMLTDEVEINLNMLCALMLDEVDREVDSADIVIVDQSGP
jgi:hypothetical protein